ncbi:MAG: hypothetical protein AAGK37_17880 [Pseudomonadota bacterium]
MIDRLTTLFNRTERAEGVRTKTGAPREEGTRAPFSDQVHLLNADPYLMVADADLRLISVFDDLRYDRADLDMLSGPMRRRALAKLGTMGFTQRSGSVIENQAEDVRIHLPKFRALGASPFDALRDTTLGPQDYALLTPTQAAAQIIDGYPTNTAKERLAALVVKHPVNLLRLFDFLEPIPRHQDFRPALGQLVSLQKTAISTSPLKNRYALR